MQDCISSESSEWHLTPRSEAPEKELSTLKTLYFHPSTGMLRSFVWEKNAEPLPEVDSQYSAHACIIDTDEEGKHGSELYSRRTE